MHGKHATSEKKQFVRKHTIHEAPTVNEIIAKGNLLLKIECSIYFMLVL